MKMPSCSGSACPQLTRWMVEKGSVAVNGISLTLVEVGASSLHRLRDSPHLEDTQLREAQVGDRVNIEVRHDRQISAKLV